jgi:hypothetical protein
VGIGHRKRTSRRPDPSQEPVDLDESSVSDRQAIAHHPRRVIPCTVAAPAFRVVGDQETVVPSPFTPMGDAG